MNTIVVFNTGETNRDLKSKYNPDGSVLRKAQLRMLDMLVYIDKVCKEQNISYSLNAGNVLGAVRHGGFIPWDDDVDIMLQRSDYKKLCTYLKNHPHPQFKLQSPSTDPYYINHWNVLRDTKSEYIQSYSIHNLRKYKGLQIDIFPIEENVYTSVHKVIARLHSMNQFHLLRNFTILSKLLFYFTRFFVIPLFRILGKLSMHHKGFYHYSYGLGWSDKTFKKEVLFPFGRIKFEGYDFSAPANVDEYLRDEYGEYMNLPDVKLRSWHHAEYKIWD